MNFSIDKVVENIRVVDKQRNYWFIRTYGGTLYDDFFDRSFVGIGFNSIPMSLIKRATNKGDGNTEPLKTAIQTAYELKLGEVTKAANQLIDFHQNVKIGDMIIMPSENSEEFAFGLIEGDIYQSESKGTFKFRDGFEPFPEKRRKVKWLKTLNKSDLNGDFRNLIMSRSAITDANNYRDVIEGYLSSVYIREDKLYLTIQIEQEEDINAFAFSEFLSCLTYFYAEFCKENGEEYNEELFLKIKVQSKGKVALQCLSIAGGLAIAGLFAFSDDSEVKMELMGNKIEGKSTGFLKSLSGFLDASQERKHKEERFQDSIRRLKATTIQEPIQKNEESVIAVKKHGEKALSQEKSEKKEKKVDLNGQKNIESGKPRQKDNGDN